MTNEELYNRMIHQDPEFNLLEEKWITVFSKEGELKKVSLVDVLLNGSKYECLAGENELQNAALLRLLTAFSATFLLRWNENGEKKDIENKNEALRRWEKAWIKKTFPEEAITQYFKEFKDRFWLFHPEKPFFQSYSALDGTGYKNLKLVCSIMESNNSPSLFPTRKIINQSFTKEEKLEIFKNPKTYTDCELEYDEAARWLITYFYYSDGIKVTNKQGKYSSGSELPGKPMSTGWLGKLGLITAQGANLFETILLNTVLLKDGKTKWEEAPFPLWEREEQVLELEQTLVPSNLPQLLTYPTRQLLLIRQEKTIVGFAAISGETTNLINGFDEPFTLWKVDKKKNQFTPKKVDTSHELWGDFKYFFWDEEMKYRRPGIINWLSLLAKNQMLSDAAIHLNYQSVEYKKSEYSIKEINCNSLKITMNLFSRLDDYADVIGKEVEKCIEASSKCLCYANQMKFITGAISKLNDTSDSYPKRLCWGCLNQPFKDWLLNVDVSEIDDEVQKWKNTARKVLLQNVLHQLQHQYRPRNPSCRELKPDKKRKLYPEGKIFDSAFVEREFIRSINSLFSKKADGSNFGQSSQKGDEYDNRNQSSQ